MVFSTPKEALKMVFGVRSIRVFTQFSLDPYYEPLPWFMILFIYEYYDITTKFLDMDSDGLSTNFAVKLVCACVLKFDG